MRLEWIEDILAVLKTGSLAQAAEERLRTQSAFSRRIAALEAHLGAPLFDRAAKPLRPLPAVLAQEDNMRELAAGLRALEQALGPRPIPQRRSVTIAGSHSLATTMAPRMVQEIHARFDIGVCVQSANRDQAILSLLSGEADFALFFQSTEGREMLSRLDVDIAPIGQDILVPVAPPTLIQHISTAELPCPLITYPDEVFFGRLLQQNILPKLAEERRLDLVATTALSHTVLELVLQGAGLGWVPYSLARDHLAQGSLCKLDDPFPEAPLRLVLVRMARNQDREPTEIWQFLLSRFNTDLSAED